MRVLFTTFAAKSHMHAQVPLAWALQAAGHEVRVASQPDLAEDITRTGLTAVEVGEPLLLEEQMQKVSEGLGDDAEIMESQAEAGMDMTETRPEMLTWDHVLGVFTSMTAMAFQNSCPERMIDDTVAFARAWRPDLVVWDTMSFAGPVAARVTGAAHARLLFGLDLMGRMRETFLELLAKRPPELRDDPLREWLTWTLARYGCDFAEEVAVGQWTVDPVPGPMRFPVDLTYVPVRYVPYNGQAVVPRWLHEPPGRRRVCLTLGVAHREVLSADRASIGELLEAVADLDVEVVATLNAKQLAGLGRLPGNVRAVDFVPLNALLPSCSAVIHHGGSGTFQTALIHGVPQLIVPDMVWDTIHKAKQLERFGAGLYVHDVDHYTAQDLRAQLVRLLDEPSFARNCARLRTEMVGTPSPAGIVPVLEQLTAEHRAARRGEQ
ncbi:activator-dependent family glycosyltransferase [Streptomyces sp. NPDC001678]|uniref:activator-dependent family glycosyltransferase n=1 Tax=Streptomyces sp. NPDC001678 TaxID=3364599 RepID=UPI0036A4A48D